MPHRSLLRRLHDYFFPHAGNEYKPGFFSTASVAAIVALVLVVEAGYLVQTKLVFLRTDFLAAVLPGALVALVNDDRASQDVPRVTESPLLDKAAQAAADDMAAKGYFSHVSPDGQLPWHWLDAVGYQYTYAGENLAVNFTDAGSVETAWMNSPEHRANIVKPQYTQVGIGVANGVYEGAETTFVVQFFATPAPPPAAAPPPAKLATAQATSSLPSGPSAPAVLGTTTATAAGVSAVPTTSAPGWLASILASPTKTVVAVSVAILALVLALFAVALGVKVRIQHPHILAGAAALVAVVIMALAVTSVATPQVRIAAEPAAVASALLP